MTLSICAQCKNKINTQNSIYKGFDCTFCSEHCRTKMWTKVYAMDSNFKYPEKWPNKEYKYNNVKLWTNKEFINNFNNFNNLEIINTFYSNTSKYSNICNLILIDNSYYSYMINSVKSFKEYIKNILLDVF